MFFGNWGITGGKMLVFNGLSMKMRIVNFEKKNSNCKVCGKDKEIVDIKNHEEEYKSPANKCQ